MTYDNLMECPMAKVQKIVRGKWSMLLIYILSEGTFRFSELHRKMPWVTEANLTKELRSLEEHGMVIRKVYPVVPPKVEYSLSDIGRAFLPVILELEKWAEKYVEQRE